MADDRITSMILDRFDRPIPNSGMKNRVVFWTDPKGEFSEDVDDLKLADITVLRWDGYNSFKIKERVECEEPETRFLIYMSGNIPAPEHNILADMMYYSKPTFSADSASCFCLELSISEELKSLVNEHLSFFKLSRNRGRMMSLAPFFENEDDLIRSMIAVSLSFTFNDMDSILVKMIGDYSKSPSKERDEEICNLLDRYDLLDEFWNRCKERYGFDGNSLEELVRSLFITSSFDTSEIATSPKLSRYVLPRKKSARVSLLVNRLLNECDQDDIDTLCNSISEKCGIKTILEAFDDMDCLKDCYIFSYIDSTIIERMMNRILSTRSPLGKDDIEFIRNRMKNNISKGYRPLYSALECSSKLFEQCARYSESRSDYKDAKAIVSGYSERFHVIDTLYRHFIESIDSIPIDLEISENLLKDLENYVENTYCNIFLDPIVSDLCDSIKDYSDLPGPYQQDFCEKHIDENRKTAIIISDAFRYECANELFERLKTTSRVNECRLDHMISTVPSKTSFGMAALLPNNGLEVRLDDEGKFGVFIEGQSTESSFRQTILQSRYPDSIVMKYEYVKDSRVSDLRKELSGKKVIYIYHDAIDKTGESDERNVFSACSRAIDEIDDLITKITNCNCTNFIITADHGFIYRRSEIEEYDKISTVKGFNSKRRFALNDHPFGLDRCVEFSMDYLGDSNEGLYVSVPDSIALFRRQGETKCYAHEGISPQEIIVPVLTVNTKKGAVTEKYVGLKPSNKRDIKQFNPRIELWQDNPVNDEYRKCEYELWLEDENDQPISQIYSLIADKDNPSDLRHNLMMKEELRKNVVTLVIRMKGESEKQRFEGFRVKRVGLF